jgi:Short C-terminal domain
MPDEDHGPEGEALVQPGPEGPGLGGAAAGGEGVPLDLEENWVYDLAGSGLIIQEVAGKVLGLTDHGGDHVTRRFIKPTHVAQRDPIRALSSLQAMRDRGLISEEEFAAKKVEILARI